MKKLFLEEIIPAIHIYSCFLQEEEKFKSSKRGRPSTGRIRDPVTARFRNQIMGRLGTSTGRRQTYFLNLTYKHIKLTLIGYSRL